MNNTTINALSNTVFVSPQIQAADIPNITALGINTVICHRPDVELSTTELDHSTLTQLLGDDGIELIYQPIAQVTMPEVEHFSQLLETHETPILAYCTTGTRSTMLWALSQMLIGQTPRDVVIEIARQAGYDLDNYLPQ